MLDTVSEKKAAKSFNMYDGRTILHLAAADNDLKLCKKLVSCGADINSLMKSSVVSDFVTINSDFVTDHFELR